MTTVMTNKDDKVRATLSGIALGGVAFAIWRRFARLTRAAPATLRPVEPEEPRVIAARLVG